MRLQVTIATLTSALEQDADGLYFANAVVGASQTPARVYPCEAPGFEAPWYPGDQVLVAAPEGNGGSGWQIVGRLAQRLQSGPDTILSARGVGDVRVLAAGTGGVYLGKGAKGSQQKIAINDEVRADLDSLQRQVDYLVALLNSSLCDVPGSPLVLSTPVAAGAFTTQLQALLGSSYTPQVSTTPTASVAPTAQPASNVYAKAEGV